jgi:LmbE family N-acetylglucosaminyl deacetylase
MPVSDAVSAARRWIRERSDARFTPRRDVVDDVLARIASTADAAEVPQKVLIVVAHPDDEAIGAGAVMRGIPGVVVVHVTDGAPADPEYAHRKGFASRDDYARQRRQEVTNALKVIGISGDRIRGLGFVDGEAAWQLVDLCHRMMDLFEELKPDVVLTHPYEGGHSDHDSTAFAVHLAAGLLNRDGGSAPLLLELTSYHNYNGRRRLFDFLPFTGARVKTVELNAEQREIKRQMFAAFTSQAELLKKFPVAVERFRQAPRYLFTVAPHDGQLDYERLCKRMTGAEWRAQAERALETLRARTQFRGGFPASDR